MKQKFLLLLIAITFMGCTTKKHIDFVAHNAMIYTVDDNFSVKEAMAVDDGIILETGNAEDILAKYDADVILDAKASSIYPGFIDGHCHFFSYGVDILQMFHINRKILYCSVYNKHYMTFIRKVKVGRNTYLAEVKSIRNGDKVKQKFIRYVW